MKFLLLLDRRSSMSVNNKLYTAQIWGYTHLSLFNSLHRKQNRLLRIIYDAHWFMRIDQQHHDVNLSRIDDHIRYITIRDKFFANVNTHPSLNIKAMTTKTPDSATSGPGRWTSRISRHSRSFRSSRSSRSSQPVTTQNTNAVSLNIFNEDRIWSLWKSIQSHLVIVLYNFKVHYFF